MTNGKWSVALCAAVLAGASPAETTVVGTYDFLEVTDDASTPMAGDAAVLMAPVGCSVRKTGDGTWTMPVANFFSRTGTVDVDVRGGTVKLVAGTAPDFSVQPAALQSAALWLDAAKNVATGDAGATATAWYDAREADAVATAYGYAQAGSRPPDVKDRNGATALSFHGYMGSDATRGMRFKNAAGADVTFNVVHAFVVHQTLPVGEVVEDDVWARWGGVLGTASGNNPYFGNASFSEPHYVSAYGNAQAIAYAMRFYRDGIRTSATDSVVSDTREVLEYEFPPDTTAATETLCNDRGLASGGGSVFEVVLFTNRLSEVDRLSVSEYLNRKWNTTAQPRICLRTAAGTMIDAQEAASGNFSVTGEGALLLANGRWWTGLYGSEAFDGVALALAGRTLGVDAIALPWRPSSGETLTIRNDATKTVNTAVSATNGTAGMATVDGTGYCEVRVREMPADVKTLKIAAGTLALAATATADATTVAVPNGDFERTSAFTRWTIDNTAEDWTFNQGSITDGAPSVNVTSTKLAGYARANWGGMASGEKALLLLSTNGTATSSAVTLPAGTYRLRADVCRWGTGTDSWHDGDVEALGGNCRCGNTNSGQQTVLRADILIGEETRLLGGLYNMTLDLTSRTFPTTFTLTEATPVRVVLRQTKFRGAAQVDNLVFEALDTVTTLGDELIVDGSFEKEEAWTFDDFRDAANVRHVAYPMDPADGGASGHWGTERCDGAFAVRLTQQGRAMQTIDFPVAGAYRLSFWARPRVENGSVNYETKLRAWIQTPDGVTTQAIYTTTTTLMGTNFLEHQSLFTVPAAGTWTLCLATVRGAGGDAFADCVSVRRVTGPATTPALKKETVIDVAEGATLRLDYAGTCEIGCVRYAGTTLLGEISAATHPEFVAGTGALFTRRRNTVLIFR